MLDPKNCLPGQEQYEKFPPAIRNAKPRYQYDYRTPSGKLFSCVKPTLEECRKAKDMWALDLLIETVNKI